MFARWLTPYQLVMVFTPTAAIYFYRLFYFIPGPLKDNKQAGVDNIKTTMITTFKLFAVKVSA
jgi:hypothetical protein